MCAAIDGHIVTRRQGQRTPIWPRTTATGSRSCFSSRLRSVVERVRTATGTTGRSFDKTPTNLPVGLADGVLVRPSRDTEDFVVVRKAVEPHARSLRRHGYRVGSKKPTCLSEGAWKFGN